MAFDSKMMLPDEKTENIVGGVNIANDFGDGTVYKLGLTSETYAYTFSANRKQDVVNVVLSVNKADYKTFEAYNAAVFAALKATPGLLTPIEGCPAEWY